MNDDLLRVESAVSATSSGNLTWELWPHDCATALGFAGQRNPLGFAVVRYLSDPPSGALAWQVILALATRLIHNGHDRNKANDIAWAALDAWNRIHCGHCGGRGVVSFDQKQCPVCAGTGEKKLSEFPESVRDGISCLMEAERWMEGQLAARLKGANAAPAGNRYQLNLPVKVGNHTGTGGSPATPAAPSHE